MRKIAAALTVCVLLVAAPSAASAELVSLDLLISLLSDFGGGEGSPDFGGGEGSPDYTSEKCLKAKKARKECVDFGGGEGSPDFGGGEGSPDFGGGEGSPDFGGGEGSPD